MSPFDRNEHETSARTVLRMYATPRAIQATNYGDAPRTVYAGEAVSTVGIVRVAITELSLVLAFFSFFSFFFYREHGRYMVCVLRDGPRCG